MTIKKRTKKKYIINFSTKVLVVVFTLLLMLVFFLNKNHFDIFGKKNIEEIPRYSSINEQHSPKDYQELNPKNIEDTSELALVNKEHSVSNKDIYLSPTTEESNVSLRPQALSASSALVSEALNKVGGSIAINSGFRSFEEQAKLYDEAEDKSFVQPPGHSEHETGLAVDIAVYASEDVENTTQSKYLRKNSWKHGLILRYPKDKIKITGIANEPWHFRYVGKIHAWYMYNKNLSLEEYIDFIKTSKTYTEKLDGKIYTVSYHENSSSSIFIPINVKYSFSSDNTGGYILTTWTEP